MKSQSKLHQAESTAKAERRSAQRRNSFKRWLLDGMRRNSNAPPHQTSWWKVMCLTGVDYFSTLGYQPGIAYLAAGLLSPLATLVLVLLTLLGALPVYREVAKQSPHGQGSISMLEKLLPGWRGKALVLVLLGFAATDFIITMTLSAADATAHVVENPLVMQLGSAFLTDRILVTSVLLIALAAVFLMGFREAIGLSVLLVAVYLGLNAVAVGVSMMHVFENPSLLTDWHKKIFQIHYSWPTMIGLSLILFPKLALGMSGFETGVAVMPLVKSTGVSEAEVLADRIKNTRKLLLTAAVTMSFFLLGSAVATTLLIPAQAFAEGGEANGRAISYLAHKFLGHGFGTIYDISSIAILWFAGASAMAGLLNLVPKYLPRYGMAPDWARAQRPLVLFFSVVSLIVTALFRADVDAQAGAYATGVLVLMTSAAVAVTLTKWHTAQRWPFLAVSLVFVYTTVLNMIERPEGLHIAMFFIGAILATSLISRAIRSLELRISNVRFDATADELIRESLSTCGTMCLLAHRPDGAGYQQKELETREVHKLTSQEAAFVFLEVTLADPSEFIDDELEVSGHRSGDFRILRCTSPASPNAIAAVLLHLRNEYCAIPQAYFGWTEGQPIAYIFKYVFLGEGETAPLTREILRSVEPNPAKRPRIIVG